MPAYCVWLLVKLPRTRNARPPSPLKSDSLSHLERRKTSSSIVVAGPLTWVRRERRRCPGVLLVSKR
jgi:hypothetical protein